MSNNNQRKNKNPLPAIIILFIIFFGRSSSLRRLYFSSNTIPYYLVSILPFIIMVVFIVGIIAVIIRISNKNKNISHSQDFKRTHHKSTGQQEIKYYSIDTSNKFRSNNPSNINMPNAPFPCENCGNILKPGTLFCPRCDTKVDYSKFNKK